MELLELIEIIGQKTLLSSEEVMHNIEMKQKEFSGLISLEAAGKIIANELGIVFPDESPETEYLTIGEIQQKKPIGEADIIARIFNINSPKDFETQTKRGRVCNIEIADTTGKGTLVLWDEDVWWLEKNSVERNDVIVVRSGQIKTYNPLELHSQILTEISIIKERDFPESKYFRKLPLKDTELGKLDGLKEGVPTDLYCRILQISNIREFSREGKIGKVLNIMVLDNSGKQIAVALWDGNAENAARNYKIGDAIKIENGVPKKTASGFEIQTSWNSHILHEPRTHDLKKQEEMLEGSIPKARLLDIKNGEKGLVNAFFGKIDDAQIQNGKISVFAQMRDEINVHVIFEGKEALEILQIRQMPKIPLDLVVKLKEEYLKGKNLKFVARKEKDKEGGKARYYCENILHFN
ncbi:hypothetical protein HY989_01225 [Candidatus Micrarchaeota archaeon]|nr:hypothetical protein [Candidatus Micrarchaeota archaeon]